MKTKIFDCVEMKHKGAQKIRETLSNMTKEETLIYLQKKTDALKQHQAKLKEETPAT